MLSYPDLLYNPILRRLFLAKWNNYSVEKMPFLIQSRGKTIWQEVICSLYYEVISDRFKTKL